jgi:hypothetical protein
MRVMRNAAKRFFQGWTIIFRALWTVMRLLFENFELLWELITGRKKRGTRVGCFTIPQLRARPDPYMYSQFWLFLRGIAFTWDNPDFAIIDPLNGSVVDSHALAPHKEYLVRMTIHNSSIMKAVDTTVTLEVLRFGAGTVTLQTLGTANLDVPALGSGVAQVSWMTPDSAGHNCLRATIFHPDDANPLNNVGQQNTDVAAPASPTSKLNFHVGNQSKHVRRLQLSMNSYRLPSVPLRPGPPRGSTVGKLQGEGPARTSPAYLQKLREINDFAKFPVPAFLQARLENDEIVLQPGQEIETFVEVTPPKAGQGRQHVNVNVMLDGMLLGGVTAYVEEA